MPHKVRRVPYAPSASRKRAFEGSLALPEGDWVVWWYSTMRRNAMDNTVPLIKVIFRHIQGEQLLDEFVTRRIALSRLCFYQPGYILVDNVLSERLATDSEWFDVDFRRSEWKQPKLTELGLTSPDSTYLLPEKCSQEQAFIINIGNGRKLILNCVEFLVRGYSRRSEIPRILATYSWNEAEARLFAKRTPDDELVPYKKTFAGNEKWIVYPHPDMVEDDYVLLAHIANDKMYAGNAAKTIYSQIPQERYKKGEEIPIIVIPWFNSQTKLKCRGFWSADKMTYYCTELVGFQLPAGITVDARREHSTRTPTPEDRIEKERLIALPDDPLTIALTDVSQPWSQFPAEEIEDDSFEVIGNRVVEVTRIPKLTGQQKTLHKDGPQVEDYSTGDAAAQRNSTTGKAVLATREFGVNSSGILYEMWNSFQRLKEAKQIHNLWWFIPPSETNTNSDFQCVALADSFESPEATNWLRLKSGGQRGLLLMLIKVQNKRCMIVEIQRNEWINKNGMFKEDSFSGLVCEVSGTSEAAHIVKELNQWLPSRKGVFKGFKSSLSNKIEIFEHRPTGDPKGWCDATAVLALSKLGIKVQRPKFPEANESEQD